MKEHEFTLIVAGDLTDEAVVDALYEAGCDDATVGVIDGVGIVSFIRESSSLTDAVTSAIADVESVPGLRVRRVEPDDVVTMAEIAERLDRSRESVRLLIAGERGPGTFPPPVSHARTRMRLWRWSEVADWADVLTIDERQDAQMIALANALLEARWVQQAGVDEKAAYHLAETLGMPRR